MRQWIWTVVGFILGTILGFAFGVNIGARAICAVEDANQDD